MTEPRERHYEVADLTEAIKELTDARDHRQSYRAGWRNPANRTGPIVRDWTTRQDSLLDQLRAAIVDRTVPGSTRAGQIAQPSPPRFDTDAFDRMETIRTQAAEWCERLDIPSESKKQADLINRHLTRIQEIIVASRTMGRPAANAIEILRQAAALIRAAVEPDLVALCTRAAVVDQETLDALTRAALRWRIWCRILTGWDTPARRPHVACPAWDERRGAVCGAMEGERAGLRIRIEGASGTGGILPDASAQGAVCLTCNTTWDATQVGLLAGQIAEQEKRDQEPDDDGLAE